MATSERELRALCITVMLHTMANEYKSKKANPIFIQPINSFYNTKRITSTLKSFTEERNNHTDCTYKYTCLGFHTGHFPLALSTILQHI